MCVCVCASQMMEFTGKHFKNMPSGEYDIYQPRRITSKTQAQPIPVAIIFR